MDNQKAILLFGILAGAFYLYKNSIFSTKSKDEVKLSMAQESVLQETAPGFPQEFSSEIKADKKNTDTHAKEPVKASYFKTVDKEL